MNENVQPSKVVTDQLSEHVSAVVAHMNITVAKGASVLSSMCTEVEKLALEEYNKICARDGFPRNPHVSQLRFELAAYRAMVSWQANNELILPL